MARRPVAFITGANRGIGLALAKGFIVDGYSVIAAVRSEAHLDELRRECGAGSEFLFPLKLDLSNLGSIAPAIREVTSQHGEIDVLVNNAGRACEGTLEVTPEDFEDVLRVNLTAPFALLREIAPSMHKRGSGMILNVASRAGKIGFAEWGAYGASKFGLVGLGESLYRELCPGGVKVVTLCPSWVDTRMARDSGSPLSSEEMIQPEDLMKTIRWLQSLSPAACVREVIIECRGDIS